MIRLSKEAQNRLEQGFASDQRENPARQEALGASIVLLDVDDQDHLVLFSSELGELPASTSIAPGSRERELARFPPEVDAAFALEPEPNLGSATIAPVSEAPFVLARQKTSRWPVATAAVILCVVVAGLLGTTAFRVFSTARSGDRSALVMRRLPTDTPPGRASDPAPLEAPPMVASAPEPTAESARESMAFSTTAEGSRTPVVPEGTPEPTTGPANEERQPLAVRPTPATPPALLTDALSTIDLPVASAATPIASAATIAPTAPISPSATEMSAIDRVAPPDAPPPALAPAPTPVAEAPRSTDPAGTGPAGSAEASATGATPAIQLVLGRYLTAFNDRNASIAKSVWPSLDEKKLGKAFDQLEQQEVAFDACQIDVSGVQAVASCRGRAVYVRKVGSRAPRVEPRTWMFRLNYTGQSWFIAGVQTS